MRVLYGVHVQEGIKDTFGNAGSNLYVSVAFAIILGIAGSVVLIGTWRTYRAGATSAPEKPTRLALWVRSINIPYTMIYFPSIGAKVSFLVTIPLGFATGMLAATIAVGGFVGVPAMIYVLGVPSMMASATELVIAFIMGLGGTIKYGLSGYVGIRLAMIILAGSLFGIQIGAIGTTYVKPFIVKGVMGGIMMLVLISRLFMIPVYLAELGQIPPLPEALVGWLKGLSFGMMTFALVGGAAAIVGALLKGMADARDEAAAAEKTKAAKPGTG